MNLYDFQALKVMIFNLAADILKQANTIFHTYLWNCPDKVKRNAMIADYDEGGLKRPHIESIVKKTKNNVSKKISELQFSPLERVS